MCVRVGKFKNEKVFLKNMRTFFVFLLCFVLCSFVGSVMQPMVRISRGEGVVEMKRVLVQKAIDGDIDLEKLRTDPPVIVRATAKIDEFGKLIV